MRRPGVTSRVSGVTRDSSTMGSTGKHKDRKKKNATLELETVAPGRMYPEIHRTRPTCATRPRNANRAGGKNLPVFRAGSVPLAPNYNVHANPFPYGDGRERSRRFLKRTLARNGRPTGSPPGEGRFCPLRTNGHGRRERIGQWSRSTKSDVEARKCLTNDVYSRARPPGRIFTDV